MPTRMDMIFNYKTSPVNNPVVRPQRQGGFSESLWLTSDVSDLNNLPAAYDSLADARARILPRNLSWVATRFTTYNIGANSLTATGMILENRVFTPNQNAPLQDVAGVCLDVTMRANGPQNIRKFRIGGFPDSWLTGGEFDPTASGGTAGQLVAAYLAELQKEPWRFLGKVLNPATNPKYNIISGTPVAPNRMSLTLENPGGGAFAAGDRVTLMRVRNQDNQKLSGNVIVVSYNAPTLVVEPMTQIPIGRVGAVRKISLGLVPFGAVVRRFGGTHKIGRPFDQFHGRRSNRT